jgi:signal transduction histidine kinase
MTSFPPSPPQAAALRPGGYPFRGPGALARAAPFAAIAVLAEASLALSSSVGSAWAVLTSVVLLLAIPPAFFLPWARLPAWTPVLVPLAYTGSVLALILAAGATSGVGIVVLVPLVWTSLFQRPWESACVIVAIVTVEVITSLTPVAVADVVLARRVILWAALATVLSVATHGLRARIRRSEAETAQLQEHLRAVTLLEDRDRIAADLQDRVIQQVFAAGLSLQGSTALIADPGARRRVAAAVDDLDEVIRVLRDSIFGLQKKLAGRGLSAEIRELSASMSPEPEVSFTGHVDGALTPQTRARLLDILREVIGVAGRHATPARIGIAEYDASVVATIEMASGPGAAEMERLARQFPGPHDSAAAGIRAETQDVPGGHRFTWHVASNLGVHSRM